MTRSIWKVGRGFCERERREGGGGGLMVRYFQILSPRILFLSLCTSLCFVQMKTVFHSPSLYFFPLVHDVVVSQHQKSHLQFENHFSSFSLSSLLLSCDLGIHFVGRKCLKRGNGQGRGMFSLPFNRGTIRISHAVGSLD